jgi:hypothetical protein
VLRKFGDDVYDDGSFVIPLNDVTTIPVLDALLRSSK